MTDQKDKFNKKSAATDSSYILVAERQDGAKTIEVKDLTVSLPGDRGVHLVKDVNMTLNAGDRVVMTGASGSGKTTVAKALLNQWDYGTGLVVMPSGVKMMAMSQQPHFPNGPLRAIMNMKPDHKPVYKDEELTKALQIVGHDRLIQHIPGQQVKLTMDDFMEKAADIFATAKEQEFSEEVVMKMTTDLSELMTGLVNEQFEVVQFVPDEQGREFAAQIYGKLRECFGGYVALDLAATLATHLVGVMDLALAKPLRDAMVTDMEKSVEKYGKSVTPYTPLQVDFMAGRMEKSMKKHMKAYLNNEDTDDKARPIRINGLQAEYVASEMRKAFVEDMQPYVNSGTLSQIYNAAALPVSLLAMRSRGSKVAFEMTQRMTSFMDRQVWTGNDFKSRLSGGERQKLTMAIAFLHKPDILILDEITAALDEKTGIKLYKELMEQLPEESIVISIAHNKHIIQFHTHHAHLENQTINMTEIDENYVLPEQDDTPEDDAPSRSDAPVRTPKP